VDNAVAELPEVNSGRFPRADGYCSVVEVLDEFTLIISIHPPSRLTTEILMKLTHPRGFGGAWEVKFLKIFL
jgi:hypothetical protein